MDPALNDPAVGVNSIEFVMVREKCFVSCEEVRVVSARIQKSENVGTVNVQKASGTT